MKKKRRGTWNFCMMEPSPRFKVSQNPKGSYLDRKTREMKMKKKQQLADGDMEARRQYTNRAIPRGHAIAPCVGVG
jgi:hypothetical protein